MSRTALLVAIILAIIWLCVSLLCLSSLGCVGNRASVEIPAKPESRLPETITAAGNVMGGAWDRVFGSLKSETGNLK